MSLLPVHEASPELLSVFHTRKEAILAHLFEPEPGLFITESARVSLRALKAGYRPYALLAEEGTEDPRTQQLVEALEHSGFSDVPAYLAPKDRFLEIAGYPMTRGVLCAFRRSPCPKASDLLSGGAYRRIAVLDRVFNPANVGSIFRNAAALGIDAILLTKGCSDPLTRRGIRVSMGSVFLVPWTFCEEKLSGAGLPAFLRGYGFQTAAFALSENSVSLRSAGLNKAEKAALFLGNEGDGLPDEIVKACDLTVRIPMREGVDSLNVAAASALAFWSAC